MYGILLSAWVILPAFYSPTSEAHAFATPYALPVPFWLYAYGAGMALLISFIFFAVFSSPSLSGETDRRNIPIAKPSRDYSFRMPALLIVALQIFSTFAFAATIVCGLIGSPNAMLNINMTWFWIVFLLAALYAASIVGDFYRIVCPWRNWPQDVLQLARATYEMLSIYPAVDGKKRRAAAWESISSQIASFSSAKTKAQKAAWFSSHGISDTTFLDGVSLRDGPGWLPVRWNGPKLPDLTSKGQAQHGADPVLVQFYRTFLDEWLTGAAKPGMLRKSIGEDTTLNRDPSEMPLELRLWLWRLRDHGAAIPFLFEKSGSRVNLAAALALTKHAGAFAEYRTINEAVLPLMVEGDAPSPVLPFLIYEVSQAQPQPRRAVALLRLRDAPYETVAIGASNTGGHWTITSVWSTFDY
ncbi:hypothetical protein [Paraburkholderia sp. HD33-4]|uniref:hypothetical protein n=1 Tax=Paraburkholderia sp. HD33-4 TaxID=2883242 RepID=UPI001F1A7409|nr:hypothetical protein [Paraburkholderia sp. HD33-4]